MTDYTRIRLPMIVACNKIERLLNIYEPIYTGFLKKKCKQKL